MSAQFHKNKAHWPARVGAIPAFLLDQMVAVSWLTSSLTPIKRYGIFMAHGLAHVISQKFASKGSPTLGLWPRRLAQKDRKSTRLNSSHVSISYAVFCLKKKKKETLNYR